MLIKIGNNIRIVNASPSFKNKVKEALTLDNPIYHKLIRMGNNKALYSTPQYFKYYIEDGKDLVINRGNYERLFNFVQKANIPCEFKDETVAPKLSSKIKLKGLKLRDYQEGVPEKIIKKDNGVIKLDMGHGKTIISLKMIDLLRTTTLIIVPRNNGLNQFKDEIDKYYNYEPGVIQGNNFNIKDITVASIATLRKRNLASLQNQFGMIIFDECHTMISDKSIKVLSGFKARYVYGMSATPERGEDDGRSKAINFCFGEVLVDEELPRKKPRVYTVNTNAEIAPSYNYAEMIESQVESQERNDLIVFLVKEQIRNGRRALVLTKRVNHYKKVYNQLKTDGIKECHCVNSSGSRQEKEKQEKMLRCLKKGNTDFKVILGTYSMLSTGVDVPALDTLIFAGDVKESLLVKQSAGRIMRLFEGKKQPKIFDLDDNLNPILHRQYQKRKAFYKKSGWEIIKL